MSTGAGRPAADAAAATTGVDFTSTNTAPVPVDPGR
jgi:hypothetical protein